MRKLLCLLLWLTSSAWATTYNVTPASSLQTVINGTSAGDTVSFAAGTYTVSSVVTLKCGVTYTGPTVSLVNGVPTPTAILNGAGLTISSYVGMFALYSSGSSLACSTPTVIQYLNFKNASGITVQTPFTNLTIQYNTFTYIPGAAYTCGSSQCGIATGAIQISACSGCTAASTLSNTTVQWNQIGDPNSCISPTNVMTRTGVTEDYEGACFGMQTYTSINGLTVQNNTYYHVSEGNHINCPNFGGSFVCEYPDGATTQNITVQNNDFNQIHRIAWEEQPQQSAALVLQNNSFHDFFDPYFGTDGLSMACCYNNTIAQPNLTVVSNTVAFNIAPTADIRYGFGFEAMGNQATYNHNYLASGAYTPNSNSQLYPAPAIAWGCGPVGSVSYNYGIGRSWDPDGAIKTEGITNGCADNTPTSLTGNITGATVYQLTSASPTISPSPGAVTFPATITLTDAGFTGSTTGPLGNTGIWYTTDGSSPVPGSGTAQYASSGSSFTLSSPATVKAVGMWGSINQPTSWPSGYGWTPSSVVSAAYTSSGASPTVSSVALALSDGTSTVAVGSSKQACAVISYSSGPTQTICSGSDTYGNTPNTWTSASTGIATITTSGSVAGVSAGTANLTVKVGSQTSPNFALTVTAMAPVFQSAALTCPTSLTAGQSGACTAQCTYSGPVVSTCTSSAGSWTSSQPATATVNSSGTVTAVAAGSTVINAQVNGVAASPASIMVTSASPPAATLVSAQVTYAPASVMVGVTTAPQVTCTYSDGTQTNCLTADGHGNSAGSFTSSSTPTAIVNSSTGVATGEAAGSSNIGATITGTATVAAQSFALTVTAVPSQNILGNATYNTYGGTSPNYQNAQYAVMPSGITASTSGCTFYLPVPTSGTYTAGKQEDCLLSVAPTSLSQSASVLCHGTYTFLGTSADYGFHFLPITNCGALGSASAAVGYQIGLVTNMSGTVPQGYSNCGGNCTGAVPTSNVGTYPCGYLSQTYASYSGNGTTLTHICGIASGVQQTAYFTITSPTPTLTGGYLVVPGSTANLTVGTSLQIYVAATYSDGTSYFTPSPYGDTLTSITSSNPAVATVGAVGSAQPGLVNAVTTGTTTITAMLTGGKPTTPYTFNVSATPQPLPPVAPRSLR